MYYNSCQSLHIALDVRLQQLNSNRKRAISPEEKDMFLNDMTLNVVKQRCSAKLNSKKEGFEESKKRYEDLQSLKKDFKPTLYKYDDDFYYFNLPSDYYSINNLIGNIRYNKRNINSGLVNETVYLAIANFDTVAVNSPNIIFTKEDTTTIDTSIFSNLIKSSSSLFYYFALVKEYFKSTLNIDCYFETYDDLYYKNSLIFVTNTLANNITSSTSSITITKKQLVKQKLTFPDTNYITMGRKGYDLVSSETLKKEQNDYYLTKNLHLNCSFTIKGNKVLIPIEPIFKPVDIVLEYIKYPRLIESRINQLTDVVILDEVLDATVAVIDARLSSPTFEVSKLQEQMNN